MTQHTYYTTKIKPMRSYPTYQFYGSVTSGTMDTDNLFLFCILEALRWNRSRIRNFDDLLKKLDAPEPQDYASFSEDKLFSISYDDVIKIDIIFIDTLGVWTFRIVEPDSGLNQGKPDERPPVNGRTFTTEVSFRKQKEKGYVEIGIRTICSEPADTAQDCEVFRPRLIRALAENPDLNLMHSRSRVDGKPFKIGSKRETDLFLEILNDTQRSMPLIIIADSESETRCVQPSIELDQSPYLTSRSYDITDHLQPDKGINMTISADISSKSRNLRITEKASKKSKVKKPSTRAVPEKIKLPVFSFNELAQKLTAFAIVIFVEEKYLSTVAEKLSFGIRHGDIIIVPHLHPIETYSYDMYRNDMDSFFLKLKENAYNLPKRSAYYYGEVLFYSEAKQKEYHIRRKQTGSLEERCDLYRLERDELRKQLDEYERQQRDSSHIAENLRQANKKIENLNDELENIRAEYDKLAGELAEKGGAYSKSAERLQFYRKMIETAAHFPTDKEDICRWIADTFPNELIFTSRAQSELRKYNTPVDTAVLCDGILYLSAYAQYRRHEITLDKLEMYAEQKHWEIQGCGKETLKLHRADYTASENGEKYILDQHIKYGVRSEELIRIYFCWDDRSQKIIIGSLPKHLPTVKNST